MQTLSHQAQQTIDYHQMQLSPYMPALGMAMAKTYLVPFTALLIANVILNLLMAQIPGLFTGLIGGAASLAVFLGILFYGWRWSEARWHGTSLFVEYTSISKARRQLESEINAEKPKDEHIQQHLVDYTDLATAFIATMNSYGYMPIEAESNS